MNIEDIKKRIGEINESEGDDEQQHMLEDGLQQDFIKYISELPAIKFTSCTKEMAKLVLSTKDIEFERWCA
jgi:hypothetical protein